MCPKCYGLSFKVMDSWMVATPSKAVKSEVERCTICGFIFHIAVEPEESRPLTDEESKKLKVMGCQALK